MRAVLEAPLDALERQVFRREIERLEGLLADPDARPLAAVARRFQGGLRLAIEEIERLLALFRHSIAERERTEDRYRALDSALASARSATERRELMLGFLALITPAKRLRGDRAAFDRDMGPDCVEERYHRWRVDRWLREELLLRAIGMRLAAVIERCLEEAAAGEEEHAGAELTRLFADLEVEALLLAQTRPDARWRNRCAALRAIGTIARALPAELRLRLFRRAAPLVLRYALDQRQSVWVQREALRTFAVLSRVQEFEQVLRRRLLEMNPAIGDDLFVRTEAARLAVQHLAPKTALRLLARVLERPDPSEHVRIEVAREIGQIEGVDADRVLLDRSVGPARRRDASARVRARCLEALRERATRWPDREPVAARALAFSIVYDPDPLVRRVAIEEAVALALARRARLEKYKIDEIDRRLLIAFDTVCRRAPELSLRRAAAAARHSIVTRNESSFGWFEKHLLPRLVQLGNGETLSVRADEVPVSDEMLGRLLCEFTRHDLGIVVERTPRRYRFHKGDRWGLRLWRILHEVRHPDTAKRQGHRHTTGRVLRGALRCPPSLVAELVETKVPGERVWIDAEGSWRPFVPLVDDYLSTFSWLPWRRQRRIAIHAPEGVTEIRDRRSWWRAAWAHLRMSWRYGALARLRLASGGADPGACGRFVATMRDRFGLETRFEPASYEYEGQRYPLLDPSVAAHFPPGYSDAGSEREAEPCGSEPSPAHDATAGISPSRAPSGEHRSLPAPEAAQEAVENEPGSEDEEFRVERFLEPLTDEGQRADEVALEADEFVAALASSAGLGGLLDSTAGATVSGANGADPGETHPALSPVCPVAPRPSSQDEQAVEEDGDRGEEREDGTTTATAACPVVGPAVAAEAAAPGALPAHGGDETTADALEPDGGQRGRAVVSAPGGACGDGTGREGEGACAESLDETADDPVGSDAAALDETADEAGPGSGSELDETADEVTTTCAAAASGSGDDVGGTQVQPCQQAPLDRTAPDLAALDETADEPVAPERRPLDETADDPGLPGSAPLDETADEAASCDEQALDETADDPCCRNTASPGAATRRSPRGATGADESTADLVTDAGGSDDETPWAGGAPIPDGERR